MSLLFIKAACCGLLLALYFYLYPKIIVVNSQFLKILESHSGYTGSTNDRGHRPINTHPSFTVSTTRQDNNIPSTEHETSPTMSGSPP